MNITTEGYKVVIEMTLDEAVSVRNAFGHASNYWQTRALHEANTSEAKKILRRIATDYAKTHNEIADIIGY